MNAAAQRRAAAIWRMRHRFELEAASRFTAIADRMHALRITPRLTALARSASADEHRHARLCSTLVRHFGGTPTAEAAQPAREIAPAGCDPLQALGFEVVAMCCVTETLSTVLLGELVVASTDPTAQRVLHEIHRDEVAHARIGWAFLALHGGTDVVADNLDRILAGTVREELFVPSDDPLELEVRGLGQLTRHERLQTFAGVMRQVVFPGLQQAGVGTHRGSAWLDARVPNPAAPAGSAALKAGTSPAAARPAARR
jgi:hypothetical protein